MKMMSHGKLFDLDASEILYQRQPEELVYDMCVYGYERVSLRRTKAGHYFLLREKMDYKWNSTLWGLGGDWEAKGFKPDCLWPLTEQQAASRYFEFTGQAPHWATLEEA